MTPYNKKQREGPSGEGRHELPLPNAKKDLRLETAAGGGRLGSTTL